MKLRRSFEVLSMKRENSIVRGLDTERSVYWTKDIRSQVSNMRTCLFYRESAPDFCRSKPVELKHCCLPNNLLYLAEVEKVRGHSKSVFFIRQINNSIKCAWYEIMAETNLIVLNTIL